MFSKNISSFSKGETVHCSILQYFCIAINFPWLVRVWLNVSQSTITVRSHNRHIVKLTDNHGKEILEERF